MQATKIMDTEILKPEMPEILKFDFLQEKFENEFLLKTEQQAQKTVLAKHQQQRQKSRMKGGSSFASKYQAGPSGEEKCPTAKEGFGNIFYYDEKLENGTVTVISLLLGKPFDVSTDFCLQYEFHSESITNNEKLELVRVGYGNRYELRSEYVIEYVEANRNSLRVMVTELCNTHK